MRVAVIICLAAFALTGCALVQDEYDRYSIEECREAPGSNARLDCERQAWDAISDRRRDQAIED